MTKETKPARVEVNDWHGLKIHSLTDRDFRDLCDLVGINTDFDNHGFMIKRGKLRAALAEIKAYRLSRRDDAEREGMEFEIVVGLRRKKATVKLSELLRLINGGASFGSVRLTTPEPAAVALREEGLEFDIVVGKQQRKERVKLPDLPERRA